MSQILTCFQFQILLLVLDSFQPLAGHLVVPCSPFMSGTTLASHSRFPKHWENLALDSTVATQGGSRAPDSSIKKIGREDGSLFSCVSCPLPEPRLLTSLSLR